MSTIIKIFFVCIGTVTSGVYSVNTGFYWPLMVTGIGLFGYLFCELFVLRPAQKEG